LTSPRKQKEKTGKAPFKIFAKKLKQTFTNCPRCGKLFL